MMLQDEHDLDSLTELYYSGQTGLIPTLIERDAARAPASEAPGRRLLLWRSYLSHPRTAATLSQELERSGPALDDSLVAATKRLVDYLVHGNKQGVLELASLWRTTNLPIHDTARVMLAWQLCQWQELEMAFYLLVSHHGDVECRVCLIYIYLSLQRFDLAEQELVSLQENHETHLLVQLAEVWTILANPKSTASRWRDALLMMQDVVAQRRERASVRLQVALAVCRMKVGSWQDAESSLKEAAAQSPKDADLLANSIALATHLHRESEPIWQQLLQVAASHPVVRSVEAASVQFDQAAAAYAIA